MRYIDGYVLAVPTDKRADYILMAQKCAPIFKKYGALQVVETWGDDVPEGILTSFPLAVKSEPNETVVFSWIVWPDKDKRNQGMKAAMNDPDMSKIGDMPFDGKRMIFGGFQTILDE